MQHSCFARAKHTVRSGKKSQTLTNFITIMNERNKYGFYCYENETVSVLNKFEESSSFILA